MLPWLILVVSIGTAVLVPLAYVATRQSTKRHRQGIVEDLKLVFDTSPGGGTIIPSFEFVKYKYSVGRDHKRPDGRDRADFLAVHWVLSAIPFVLLCSALNAVTLAMVLHKALRLPVGDGVDWLRDDAALPLFAWVLLTSYAGAVMFTLRSFQQAINNFDLSPFSLLGAFANMSFAMLSAPILVFGVFRLGESVGIPLGIEGTAAFPIVLIGAFTAGYFPDAAVRTILRWSRLRFYKHENVRLLETFTSTPLEVIDGIDSEIRSRLGDYHIATVQNLAAANPLMLFVETPYGVYQIMDWVAQAQLCASVGPTALARLWKLGVRTIFDLERILLDPACQNDALVAAVGAILWQRSANPPAGAPAAPGLAAPGFDEPGFAEPELETLKADIRFRLENLHVHRLRQIFNQVSRSLGTESRRLPPTLDACRRRGAFDPMHRPASV